MTKIMNAAQPVVATAGKTSGDANAADKSSGAAGFAGALVKAVGGGGQTTIGTNATAANSLAATSSVFAGLLNQLGVEQEGQQGDSIPDLLQSVIEQLQNLLQDDKTSKDGTDKMTEWMSALQAMLEQLRAIQPQMTVGAGEEQSGSLDDTSTPNVMANLTALLPEMLNAVREAAAKANTAGDSWQPLVQAFERLQAVLAPSIGYSNDKFKLAPVPTVVDAPKTVAEHSAKVPVLESQAQAAAATPEVRKTTNAFKEPIVHWNMTKANEVSEETEAPIVQPVNEAAQPGDQSALAWSLVGQDAAKSTVVDGGKAPFSTPVPVQQFSQQVGNYLVRQFVMSGGNGITEARISLHPEHLGQVDIRIAMQDGQLTAQFVAHNGTAKEMLENQMALLRTSLQGHGIQVDKMEVVQQQPDLGGSAMFQEQGRREPGSEGEQSSKRENRRSADGTIAFEEEMERSTALRDTGFGGSINVTA